MLSKRDCIYYVWIFDNKKPKNILWIVYCKIRKAIAIGESPSKVAIWSSSKFCRYVDEGLKRK